MSALILIGLIAFVDLLLFHGFREWFMNSKFFERYHLDYVPLVMGSIFIATILVALLDDTQMIDISRSLEIRDKEWVEALASLVFFSQWIIAPFIDCLMKAWGASDKSRLIATYMSFIILYVSPIISFFMLMSYNWRLF